MESVFHTNFVARFTCIINIYVFTLTPGHPTGEIFMIMEPGAYERCVAAGWSVLLHVSYNEIALVSLYGTTPCSWRC